ncbi:hypothetical protein LTS10_002895 [Elasticomyces elasticus]|nr:hypothetical protein LTS10_002895 [Elasticomyces elasticus]
METEPRRLARLQREGHSESDARQIDYMTTQVADFGTPFVRALTPVLGIHIYEFIFNHLPWWTPGDRFRLVIQILVWICYWIPETCSVIVTYLFADFLAWKAWDEPKGPQPVTIRSLSQVAIFVITVIGTSRDITGFFTAMHQLIRPVLYAVQLLNSTIASTEHLLPNIFHWLGLVYLFSLWKWSLLLAVFIPLMAQVHMLSLRSKSGALAARALLIAPQYIFTILIILPGAYIWCFRQALKIPYWSSRRYIRQKWQRRTNRLARITYAYSALEPGEIRVLEVDRIEGEIECRLVHTRLSEAEHYDAISYTWGGDEPAHDLIVEGCLLTVGTNAFEMLQDRATSEETRRLWLDCICINQVDLREKEVQIPLMPKIYEGANRTIVFLNNEPDAEQVLSLLLDLEDRPWLVDMPQGVPDRLRSWVEFQQKERPLRFSMLEALDFRFRALAHLLVNEWFCRMWIFQEVIFSKKIHIRAGGIWIDWELFATVMKLLSDPDTYTLVGRDILYTWMHESVDVLRTDSLFPRLWSGAQSQELEKLGMHVLRQNFLLAHARDDEERRRETALARPPLSRVLSTLAAAKATNPQDMIYALLNVCEEAGQTGFTPNYSLSSSQTYVKLAHRWIFTRELPGVLQHAGIGHGRNIDVASWVPDWTCLDMTSPLRNRGYGAGIRDSCVIGPPAKGEEGFRRGYEVGDEPDLNMRLVSPRILSMKGLFVDTIEKMTDNSFSVLNFDGLFTHRESEVERSKEVDAQNLAETLPEEYEGGSRHGKQSRGEAFWRCLVGDAAVVPLRTTTAHNPAQLGLSTYSFDLKYERPAPQAYEELFEAECVQRTKKFPRLRPRKWLPPKRDLNTYFRGVVRDGQVPRLDVSSMENGAPNDPLVVLQDRRFTEAFASTAVGRKFAITEDRRMALVPRETLRGDIVCVFVGMEVPYLLRQMPTTSTRREFQLVGECYVHGIMDGEAFESGVEEDILLV